MRIKRISLLKILFIIIFIALLEPNGILYSPLHGAMGIIRYLGLFVAMLLFVGTKMYREKIPMLLIAILLWMGVSTYLYSGELSDGYIYAFSTMFTAIVLSTYGLKKFPKFYIMMMAGILSLWLLLDGLTWKEPGTFVTANGQRAFFLGTKTTITYYLVPGLVFDYVALKITKNNEHRLAQLFNIMAIGGSIVYLLQEPISTAIICLVLGCFGYILVSRFDHIIKFICKYGFLITSILNFLFISGTALNMFRQFFTSVLNESAELNGRTQIWNMVLDVFYKRPVIGYGYSSGVTFDVWQPFNTSTHNYFLHLLFTMGLIGFALYMIYIIVIHRENKPYLNENISRYLMYILVLMNIEAITESYGFNVMTFCVLVAIGYVKDLIAIKETYTPRFRLISRKQKGGIG